jgi:hypothetical protein
MKTNKKTVISTINALSVCIDNQVMLDATCLAEIKQDMEASIIRQLIQVVAQKYFDDLDDGYKHDSELSDLLSNISVIRQLDTSIEKHNDDVLDMTTTYLASIDMFSAYYWSHKYEKVTSIADLKVIADRCQGGFEGKKDFAMSLAMKDLGAEYVNSEFFDLIKFIAVHVDTDFEFCPEFMEYGYIFKRTDSDIKNSEVL